VSLDPAVDLFINGAWVDVTDLAKGRMIELVEGQDDEGQEISFSRCGVELDNDDRRFSNRHPTSLYYGLIGRNTPFRFRLGSTVHMVGEVSEWPQVVAPGAAAKDGDPATHVRVPIEAGGILRHLQQGARKLRSPLYRAISADAPRAYWPMEDGSDASFFVEAAGGPNGTWQTPPALASSSVMPGSLPVPVMTATSTINLLVKPWTDTGAWSVEVMVNVPAEPAGALDLVFWRTTGTITLWRLTLVPGSPATMSIVGWNAAGTIVINQSVDWRDATSLTELWGQPVAVIAVAGQDGGNINWAVKSNTALGGVGDIGTIAGTTGAPWEIIIPAGPYIAGTVVSHASLWDREIEDDGVTFATSLRHADALYGYAGETAGRRVERLCEEENLPVTFSGVVEDTGAMGPQQVGTLLDLLAACEDVDRGILMEDPAALGLLYRTRVDLYNQAGLTLDYSQLSDLAYTDDDQLLWNSVTVERINGSSATSVEETGPVSILDSPAGVGTYDRGRLVINAHTDDQLQHIADWTRHIGTWDDMRYPLVEVNLNSPWFANNPTLTAQVLALRVGDAFQLTGLPGWLPPDMAQVQIRGRRLRVGGPADDAILQWVTEPGWPWEVWPVETGGSTLAKTAAAGVTTLKIDTSVGPPWSQAVLTNGAYHLQIDGEAVTVTTMVTSTPGAPVAGAVVHGDNSSLVPPLPAGLAEGDALFVLAAIRSTSATPSGPAGYTAVADSSNVRLFGKYASSTESAPTVNFTGGVAGDSTSAVCFKSTGCSIRRDTFAEQGNSSAQNIGYPFLAYRRANVLQLIVGWKQDDWTSVADLGGSFTELIDSSTILGNDQGLVVAYAVRSFTGSDAAGSFVVTGGAAAVSRGFQVALRPLQTATVTRAVNGISKSLAVGKPVKGWRLGVTAL
jgi:hypothetical protein